MRYRSRLARWALRAALLFGVMFGVWGLHEAVAEDAARAAEPAASCTLGPLLGAGGTLFDSPLPCGPYSSTGSVIEDASGRTGGVATVVEGIASATRPVAGTASPVVEEIAGTGLLEPVGSVVQPVTEPIVDVLEPALGPVLDLTQPIIGSPAAPQTPPADPAVNAPPSADEPPAVTTPTTIVRPVPPIAAFDPAAPSPAWTPATAEPHQRSSDAAETTHVQWPDDPIHALGLTPGTPGSAAGNGSAATGKELPAEALPRSWAPALWLLSGYGTRGEKLADRSGQPDTRPA
ncbi:hypothetical protein ONA70_27150 [Micromonospora yasonensis]|uniref:hypothetical protein n=1 Tax=Micromonospora yasonensis TaxID=1128667 RepID=UPI002231F510|nr:hypothetical protein [Micromonospora yasonensis]MCW3843780.1 hypothetical protein [Micromonospora yasonensis]